MGGIWLGIYIGLLIIGIYNFLQYMRFFQQNEEFKPSKGRWCFEAGSYIFCVVFTLLIGLFSKLFEVHTPLSLIILALKIYMFIFPVFVMAYILSSADSLYKRYIKTAEQENISSNNEMKLFASQERETKNRTVIYKLIYSVIFVWLISIFILLVGIDNLLYYLLCMPLFAATLYLLLSAFCTVGKTEIRFKIYQWIIMLICFGDMLLLAYLFTNGSVNIESQKVIVDFDLNVLVLTMEIFFMIVPILILRKKLKTKKDKEAQ